MRPKPSTPTPSSKFKNSMSLSLLKNALLRVVPASFFSHMAASGGSHPEPTHSNKRKTDEETVNRLW